MTVLSSNMDGLEILLASDVALYSFNLGSFLVEQLEDLEVAVFGGQECRCDPQALLVALALVDMDLVPRMVHLVLKVQVVV